MEKTTIEATTTEAMDAYAAKAREIDQVLLSIKHELFRHRHIAAAESGNIGYAEGFVQDLEEVKTHLHNALDFLTGGEN
jgi:hypothetical protein